MPEGSLRVGVGAAIAILLVLVLVLAVWSGLKQPGSQRQDSPGGSGMRDTGSGPVNSISAPASGAPGSGRAEAPPTSARGEATPTSESTSREADERPTLADYQVRYSATASEADAPDHLRNLLAIAEIDPSGDSEILAARMIYQCEAFLEPELQSQIGSKVEQSVLAAGGGNGEVQQIQGFIREITGRCTEVLDIAGGLSSSQLLDRAIAKGNHFAAAEINKSIYRPRDFEAWDPEKKQAERERLEAQLLEARDACELHAFEILADRNAEELFAPDTRGFSDTTVDDQARATAIETFANMHARNLIVKNRFTGGDAIADKNEAKLPAMAQRIRLSPAELEQARELGKHYVDTYCR